MLATNARVASDRLDHLTSADPSTQRDDDPPGDGPGAAADRGRPRVGGGAPSKLARNLVIGPLILMVIGGYVGSAAAPKLLNEHPLLLLALNPLNRNLALAGKLLDAPSYYVVGFVRLVLPDPFFFVLGVWYGDASVRWMERKSPTYGGLFRQLETWFHKARYPLVFIAPNNPVCLLAGASGMSVTGFAVANATGTVARLWLFRWFGNVFNGPLDATRRFIGDYRIPLMIVSTLLVVLTIWSEHRKGRGLGDLANIDAEGVGIDAEGVDEDGLAGPRP
ncbi:MAG: hypothetical protein JWN46_1132 [Acidimicrobiales bacterium]|nr:hypothetical protein [Acidimicrobiales bacterium]